MSKDWSEDIYLKLLDDIIGKKLTKEKIYIPILRNSKSIKCYCNESINKQLVESCDELKRMLKAREMCVGVQDDGYIEPCPISYTGAVITGTDKFRTAFIGLNPHLEPPKAFPKEATLADLANLHHPDDIIHNREEYRRNIDNDIFINSYWRVFGHIEGKSGWSAWSPYYKTAIRVHLAFISEFDKIELNTWTKFRENKIFQLTTENILKILKQYPMVNAELIPYKSRKYNMNNFTEIFASSNPFADMYINYYHDIWNFIDTHSENDAYIFIPSNYSAKEDTLTKVYNTIKNEMQKNKDIRGEIYGKKYLFIKEKDDKFINEKEKGELVTLGYSEHFEEYKNRYKDKYKISPMYLCKWTDGKEINRKVIITTSLSGRGTYNWIYLNFDYGWIDALKEYYGQ